jgi:hypothetical protein
MHSGSRKMCCHIQISPDQRLFTSFPEHFGGYTVFLRLCMPSHPPYTLSSLTTLTKDRPPAGREAHEIVFHAWYSRGKPSSVYGATRVTNSLQMGIRSEDSCARYNFGDVNL